MIDGRVRIRSGGALVGVAAVLLLASAAALAHRTSYRSASSFAYNPGEKIFVGHVDNSIFVRANRACRGGRLVKLYRERGRVDPLVGSDRTDSAGYWEIRPRAVPPARYYAKVLKKDIGPGAHEHICRAYRTSTLFFG